MTDKTQLPREHIHLSSYSPGRVRLRFDPAGAPLPALQDFLQIPVIEEVAFRKFSGSLLIRYDANFTSLSVLLETIEAKFRHYTIERPRSNAKFDKNYPRDPIFGAFFHYRDSLNRVIHNKTGGMLDLRAAMVMVYVAWCVVEFSRNPLGPRWWDIGKELTAIMRHFEKLYEE